MTLGRAGSTVSLAVRMADHGASATPSNGATELGVDGGAHPAMRRCIVTHRVLPKEAMIRFAIAPGDAVVPDIPGKLPGRGLWLSAARNVVNTAGAKGLFARAARRRVVAAAGLADEVERLLAARALDLLGLARRASQAAAGFEKVRNMLASGRAAVLIAARDGAPAGRARLRAAAPNLALVDLFSSAELGRALGRETVVHVALARGRLADRFLVEARRLSGFRPQSADGTDVDVAQG